MGERFKSFVEKFREQTGSASLLEVHGKGELMLTGCRNLLDYNESSIMVDTVNGIVKICGRRLEISAYRQDLLSISGEITVIDMGGIC